MRTIERIHRGRVKQYSWNKLHRLFKHHSDWDMEDKLIGPYTVYTFRKGEQVKVFEFRMYY